MGNEKPSPPNGGDDDESNTVKPAVKMNLKNIKKTKPPRPQQTSSTFAEQFEEDDQHDNVDAADAPPLVIPVQGNSLRFRSLNEQDNEAARALEQQQPTSINNANNNTTTIAMTANTDDTLQYRAEMEQLPAELKETDDAYQRVPIADFGAALLRGMGWKEEDNTSADDPAANDTNNMPRPHRLGLGAIPKLPETTDRRPRRIEEYERDKKRAQQYQAYQHLNVKKQQQDPQQTLQRGSIVYYQKQRARMVQLQGVPGLNRVRIHREGESEPISVPKRSAQELVPRSVLEKHPFQEQEPPKQHEEQQNVKKEDDDYASVDDKKRKRDTTNEKSKKHKKKRKERQSTAPTWLIPHIRVRVITKRYGKSHYKEKGVVVDVTPKGATLQMPDKIVLDHVEEIHLETALPKPGGNCVVVGGPHRRVKGRLYERDSRSAVLQESENESFLTVSLDDIAEWCALMDD